VETSPMASIKAKHLDFRSIHSASIHPSLD
jgi:hypothetical protein